PDLDPYYAGGPLAERLPPPRRGGPGHQPVRAVARVLTRQAYGVLRHRRVERACRRGQPSAGRGSAISVLSDQARPETNAEADRLVVHMVGNAHIDPVWLWGWQAGVDEALASFRSAADRCDEYPEFVYTRGEAWLYRQVETLDSRLFERVRGLIGRGQWHVSGGQFLQPDVNGPTLSGLRRQVMHGRKYLESRFGVTSDVGYNLDSFGHPATLPDVLAELGYRAYCFHRPKPDQLELPGQAFRWRGSG